MESTSYLLGTRHLGEVVNRQVRLLCPWTRHLTGRPHLYVEDRWPRHIANGNSQTSADVQSTYSNTIRFFVNGG